MIGFWVRVDGASTGRWPALRVPAVGRCTPSGHSAGGVSTGGFDAVGKATRRLRARWPGSKPPAAGIGLGGATAARSSRKEDGAAERAADRDGAGRNPAAGRGAGRLARGARSSGASPARPGVAAGARARGCGAAWVAGGGTSAAVVNTTGGGLGGGPTRLGPKTTAVAPAARPTTKTGSAQRQRMARPAR